MHYSQAVISNYVAIYNMSCLTLQYWAWASSSGCCVCVTIWPLCGSGCCSVYWKPSTCTVVTTFPTLTSFTSFQDMQVRVTLSLNYIYGILCILQYSFHKMPLRSRIQHCRSNSHRTFDAWNFFVFCGQGFVLSECVHSCNSHVSYRQESAD